MERFLFGAFLAILFWAPLPLGSNRIWSLSLLEMLISLVFMLWLFSMSDREQRNAAGTHILSRNRPIIFLFWLIPLWSALQAIPLPPVLNPGGSGWTPLTVDISSTIYQTQESIAYAMFFTMALGMLNSPERVRRTAELLVITGVLQATYSVLVTLGGKSFDLLGIVYRPDQQAESASGTFVNRNHLAGYLEMCIAIGVGLLLTHMLENKDPFQGWRAIVRRLLINLMSGKARIRIFLGLMVVALVLSHSRMGNSAFFSSLGLSALIGLIMYRRHRQSRGLILLFASLIVIDMLILGAWFGLDQLASRLEGTVVSREERVYVYESGLNMLKDAPIVGIGAGAFNSLIDQYKTNEIFFDFRHAHNDFLQIAIEYGIIGLILFGLIVIHCFRMALVAQRARHTAVLKGAAFAAMMGIISLMIHSSVDFNLQIPANALLFTLLCALACVANSMDHQKHRSHHPTSSGAST